MLQHINKSRSEKLKQFSNSQTSAEGNAARIGGGTSRRNFIISGLFKCRGRWSIPSDVSSQFGTRSVIEETIQKRKEWERCDFEEREGVLESLHLWRTLCVTLIPSWSRTSPGERHSFCLQKARRRAEQRRVQFGISFDVSHLGMSMQVGRWYWYGQGSYEQILRWTIRLHPWPRPFHQNPTWSRPLRCFIVHFQFEGSLEDLRRRLHASGASRPAYSWRSWVLSWRLWREKTPHCTNFQRATLISYGRHCVLGSRSSTDDFLFSHNAVIFCRPSHASRY